MKKRLKGSVVIEASILTPFIILVCLFIVSGMIWEFQDSLEVVNYLEKQDTVNGRGEDTRMQGALGMMENDVFIWNELWQGREEDLFIYNIETLNLSIRTTLKMSNFRMLNWFIGRERLRSMYGGY